MAIKLRKSKKIRAYKPGETKIKMYFDRTMLNLFIGYLFVESKHITKSNLLNLNKLMEIIDDEVYENNVEMYARVKFIRCVLDAKLRRGMEHYETIINYCRKENEPEYEKIIAEIEEYTKLLNYNEIKFLNKDISDKLKYAFILFYKEMVEDIYLRINTGEFKTMEDVVSEVKLVTSYMMNDIRKADNISSIDTFSLSEEIMDPFITRVIERKMNPANVLKTGIKELNTMLCGGFMPGRLYLWLGISGGFKSSMLIHCARWIKLYNKVEPKKKDAGVVPTILLITMENSVDETVERLFNMAVADVGIDKYSAKDAIKLLKDKGKLTLENGDVDIVIKYYSNYEIATDDLYGIIEDLEDDNREVICLIIDYIKRIRPAIPSTDERVQLKNASNELKDLAIKLDIPVITAQQINRAGNTVVEEAIRSGKVEVAKGLGATDVALAWDLIENSDWVGIIAMVKIMNNNQYYLTIKNPKCRMKKLVERDYINHPFEVGSKIRLIDDVNMDKSLSLESLETNINGGNIKTYKKGSRNAKDRAFEDDEDSLEDFTKYINRR